ncbi:MAG: methenyltetrahydromethanopterin cyclohydrolase [Thermoproteota archaeon]|nr:methenyltetrahydromethanopterin cyclohydrolase [Thermoproteota archaeon]
MWQRKVSINRLAFKLVKTLCGEHEQYGVTVKKTKTGTTLIDCGIKAKGGFQTGRIVTEICLGGCGKTEILPKKYGNIEFPSIFVRTDNPALAILGSQFAGWKIKDDKIFALASGPARALALKPKKIYEKIGYRDDADVAVLVLETKQEPHKTLLNRFSKECKVEPDNLFILLVPTSSLAGSVQVSGRIVETGLLRLEKLGLDPKLIVHACGYAPIAPVHPKFAEAMGRTNDAILYGGVTYYAINYEGKEEKLGELLDKASSATSKSYGKTFIEILKEVNYDFHKIDADIFAPAVVMVNNVKTGSMFKVGEINVEMLMKSFGFKN